MAEGNLLAPPKTAPGRGAAMLVAGVGALLALWILNGGSIMPALAVGGALGVVAVWFGASLTRKSPEWLVTALIMVAVLVSGSFLDGPPRAAVHYGLVALLCLPCVPLMWRSGLIRRGGYELYVLYFAWAACTVVYSLAPAYSAARLGDAVLTFCAISVAVLHVESDEDVTRMMEHFLIGCGVFVVIVAASAVLLPRSITWTVPDKFAEGVQVERFVGILNGPNTVGGLMLITVGPALAFWNRVSGGKRTVLAILSALALGIAALADSRSPFIALAGGITLYLVWRYRAKGVLMLVAAVIVGILAMPLFGRNIGDYIARGDVGTLTGRTEMWQFVIHAIEQHPLRGYGYEVAGAILMSKYFPIWYGPYDLGPQSSVHNGYLSHAAGVGIPATLFWLFITLRPWFFLFRQKEDPWNLKPVVLLVVIPLMIDNLTEAAVGDFLGIEGLLFGLAFVIGERYRLFALEQAESAREQALARMPRGLAAFRAMKAQSFP
jgi:O-antigen ligase